VGDSAVSDRRTINRFRGRHREDCARILRATQRLARLRAAQAQLEQEQGAALDATHPKSIADPEANTGLTRFRPHPRPPAPGPLPPPLVRRHRSV